MTALHIVLTPPAQDYRQHRTLEMDKFESAKVSAVQSAWEELKELSSEMAAGASP